MISGQYAVLTEPGVKTTPEPWTGSQVLASKGVNLVRFWGFVNGGTDPYTAGSAIQPKVRERMFTTADTRRTVFSTFPDLQS